MNKSQKAVAVAEDVLKQLRRRKNRLRVGGSGYLSTTYRPTSLDGDLREHLDKVESNSCGVCALGAALLSKARLFDSVPMTEVFYKTGSDNYIPDLSQSCVRENLDDVFDKTTLKTVEAAFERNYNLIFEDHECPSPKIYGAVVFGMKFSDPRKRLQAIMENIVANNGRFVVDSATKTQADDMVMGR